MRQRISAALIVIPAMLLGLGCASRNPQRPSPIAPNELQPLMARAEQPESFGIELFDTEDGVLARNVFNVKQSRTAFMNFSSRRSARLPIFEAGNRRGKTRNVLLDTSSRKSWIDFSQRDLFDAIAIGPELIIYATDHVDDDIPGILCIVPYLRLNKMVITENMFYARADNSSLWPVSRDHRQKIGMVMGCGMLKTFAFIKIDFEGRRITFSAEEPYPLEERDVIASVPIEWIDGTIHVDARINGESKKLLIDTGGDFDLVVTEDHIDELQRLVIGDLVIVQGSIDRPDAHGITSRERSSMGLGILKRFDFTIDMYRQQLHFERPEK